ncbi:hypothetical protein ABI59_08635 [Acidobacteria bacterium Mor1]|nr:hypothetical protein ABI59_08635 [Acidobacteria bacterium Mor1]
MHYRFGQFELNAGEPELRRRGRIQNVPAQPLRLLQLLVSRAGREVSRETIIAEIWSDGTSVAFDTAIHTLIRQLREVLGDNARSPTFIETLPRRGYRFIAPVEQFPAGSAGAPQAASPPVADTSPSLTAFVRENRRRAGLAVALSILGLLAMILSAFRPGDQRPLRQAGGVATVALLPLRIDGLDAAPGLTEQLIDSLGRIEARGLRIAEAGSTWQLGRGDSRDRAALFGIDYLIECRGSLRGDRIEGTLELHETRRRKVLRAERFTLGAEDLEPLERALASRIAGSLAAALESPVSPGQAMLHGPASYRALIEAQYLLRLGDRESVARAVERLRSGLSDDSESASLHAWLALALGRQAFSSVPVPPGLIREADHAARRAEELDRESLTPRLARAFTALYLQRQPEVARQALERALEIDPGSAEAHRLRAAERAIAGHTLQALDHARIARDLDPLNMAVRGDVCWYELYADRFAEAIVECRRALDLEPEDGWSLMGLAVALEHSGKSHEAAGVLARSFRVPAEVERKALEQADPATWIWGRLAESYFSGRAADRVDGFLAAVLCAGAGDTDRAIAMLALAEKQRSGWLPFLGVDPRLDPVREHPGYLEISAKSRKPTPPVASSI